MNNWSNKVQKFNSNFLIYMSNSNSWEKQKVTYFYLSMEVDYLIHLFLKHYVHINILWLFLNFKIIFTK